MNKLNKMIKAYRHGIVIPYQAMRAADNAGVPYYVLCAFLEQETAGGHNEFGHDPTIFVGAGAVTKSKYLKYKRQRDAQAPSRRRMQGVGPMQLTWYTYQDRADKLGGCWKPYINTYVGATLLHDYWNRFGDWWSVAKAYNGSAEYADEVYKKIKKWKSLMS